MKEAECWLTVFEDGGDAIAHNQVMAFLIDFLWSFFLIVVPFIQVEGIIFEMKLNSAPIN